jgi:hypothetical protein
MAGIPASYINWKLAVEGTSLATQALILDLLNAAPNAAAIAGVEPVDTAAVATSLDRLSTGGNHAQRYVVSNLAPGVVRRLRRRQ